LAILGKLLRTFGYLFSGALCLGMVALSLVVLLSGSNNFTLDMIPWWTGPELAKWMLCAGIVGLLIIALSLRGRMSGLMVLWTLAVFGTLVYGFYLSNYKYDDWDHFRTSLNITAGALVALVASVTGLFARRRA
jgi:hypothetical protein